MFRGLLGGSVGAWLLSKCIAPGSASEKSGAVSQSPPDALRRFLQEGEVTGRTAVKGKIVVDYGCGYGAGVIALARAGAQVAIGTDVREHVLEAGRRLAREEGLEAVCRFINVLSPDALGEWSGRVDLITSIDGFEHYARPDVVLGHVDIVEAGRNGFRLVRTAMVASLWVAPDVHGGASVDPRALQRRRGDAGQVAVPLRWRAPL